MKDDEFDVERWIATSHAASNDGMTYAEISQQLGIPVATVKQTVNRSLVKAARIIRRRYPEYANVHTFDHHDLPFGDRD